MFFKSTKTRDKVERHNIYIKKKAFTLSEVLIALTVIGIIAAMTISVLNSNIREAEVEAKLKKTVSVLNGAMYRASMDYGPISTWPETTNTNISGFTSKYLMPYLLTLKPIEVKTLRELGYKKRIRTPRGNLYGAEGLDDPFPRIFLNDGTVIMKLTADIYEGEYKYTVDTNGPKGPNVIGRDIFIASIFGKANNSYVAMYGLHVIDDDGNVIQKDTNTAEIINNCKNFGTYCGAMIQANGWKIPKNYPTKI